METAVEERKIEIGSKTLDHLNTARKWAMFLAIMGFIFLGIIIIVMLIAGTFLKTFNAGEKGLGIPESLTLVPLIILAIVYFFPILFLFRFSKFTSHAILKLDNNDFNKAIKNLKYYFAYIGVLIIIIFSIYVAILIVAGSSMAFLKGL